MHILPTFFTLLVSIDTMIGMLFYMKSALKKRCWILPADPPEADGGVPQLQHSPKTGGYKGVEQYFFITLIINDTAVLNV